MVRSERPTSHLPAWLVLAFALGGCVDLKGSAPAGGVAGPDAPDGGSAPTTSDASAEAPASDAGKSYEDLAADLARERVRLTDVPERWFVGKSRVYALDAAKRVRSFRPPTNGPSVEYTFPLRAWSHVSGNDEYVVDEAGDVTVYAATDPATVLKTIPGSFASVATASTAMGLLKTTASGHELIAMNPLSADSPTSMAFAATGGLVFLRARGDTLYYAEYGGTSGTKLWALDTIKTLARATPLGGAPTGADVDGGRVVVESAVGGTVKYELLEEGKAPRDLMAEIKAATGVTPAAARAGIGSFTLHGDWLIFAGFGGILAFDVATGRLVPCQIRQSDDGLFLAPRVLEDTGLLVFTRNAGPAQTSSSQGLYYVPLASVLPP